MHSVAKLGVLDFGGQYAHLVAARIRRLGAYCEIVLPKSLSARRAEQEYAGLIFSGGPASVYEPDAPRSSPQLHQLGLPVLGICYGHQLLIQQLGGSVFSSKNREYGPASLNIVQARGIFEGEDPGKNPTVWMSHGDEVRSLPLNFEVLGQTTDCSYAAVGDCTRKLFGLQFHPEVRETESGDRILRNFIRLCGLENSWKLTDFLQEEEQRIRKQVGDQKVFFLLSGGVDSTVAYTLLGRVIGHRREHLIGLHIDTGFMRQNEAREVKEALARLGIAVRVVDASDQFYKALKGVSDPEKKRQIIGELFVRVQQAAILSLGLDAGEWYLGQGTIYPDQIESGASDHSSRIKTHHNRVAAIESLLQKGRVVEPLSRLYKDEVRELGRLLNLPDRLLKRHPFPGPGLAVRCLCSPASNETNGNMIPLEQKKGLQRALKKELKLSGLDFTILPIRSVGVQGDRRSYRHCLALFYKGEFPDWILLLETARQILNRFSELNRVVLHLGAVKQKHDFSLYESADLNRERIGLLRIADAEVSAFLREKNIYDDIWQFPVVLLPLGLGKERNALVLRPVLSTDAMTASVYRMRPEWALELDQRLHAIADYSGIFYDITHKPPGTIEWE